jgi:hypothetical protein
MSRLPHLSLRAWQRTSRLGEKGYDFFAHDSMSRKIVWQIIEDFEREVTQEGARFVVVHLPTKKPLTRLRNGGHLKYQNLLGELKANYELIDPTQELIRDHTQFMV